LPWRPIRTIEEVVSGLRAERHIDYGSMKKAVSSIDTKH
jgi:hypothetical protein